MLIEQFRQCGYKAEVTELTAETLVAAQYATVWEGSQITLELDINERRPDRATFAAIQSVGGAYRGKFTGAFEPRPSGTDATAPDWYALCSASGATITGDIATWGAEALTGNPIGTAVTIKTRDGQYERTLAGTRLSKMTFKAEKGSVWSCEVEGTGRYSEAVQAAFIAAAHPSTGLGHPFLGHAVSIGGAAQVVSSIEISIEGEVTPIADGTHASGHGRNVIKDMKCMFRATILEDGATDWFGKAKNDAAADLLAVSAVMASGTAGNVLTWTGSITLTKMPEVTYVDGIGYRSIEGEFVTTSASAALTLTQS